MARLASSQKNENTNQKPIRLFYFYAPEDAEFAAELDTHLALLDRGGFVERWHQGMLIPGVDYQSTMIHRIDWADVILVLVSPNLISSTYCYEILLKRAIARHQSQEVRVIPIILRHGHYVGAPFDGIRSFPTTHNAFSQMTDRDIGWKEVADELYEITTIFRNFSHENKNFFSYMDRLPESRSLSIVAVNCSYQGDPRLQIIVRNRSNKNVVVHHVIIIVNWVIHYRCIRRSRPVPILAKQDLMLPPYQTGCFQFPLATPLIIAGDDAGILDIGLFVGTDKPKRLIDHDPFHFQPGVVSDDGVSLYTDLLSSTTFKVLERQRPMHKRMIAKITDLLPEKTTRANRVLPLAPKNGK